MTTHHTHIDAGVQQYLQTMYAASLSSSRLFLGDSNTHPYGIMSLAEIKQTAAMEVTYSLKNMLCALCDAVTSGHMPGKTPRHVPILLAFGLDHVQVDDDAMRSPDVSAVFGDVFPSMRWIVDTLPTTTTTKQAETSIMRITFYVPAAVSLVNQSYCNSSGASSNSNSVAGATSTTITTAATTTSSGGVDDKYIPATTVTFTFHMDMLHALPEERQHKYCTTNSASRKNSAIVNAASRRGYMSHDQLAALSAACMHVLYGAAAVFGRQGGGQVEHVFSGAVPSSTDQIANNMFVEEAHSVLKDMWLQASGMHYTPMEPSDNKASSSIWLARADTLIHTSRVVPTTLDLHTFVAARMPQAVFCDMMAQHASVDASLAVWQTRTAESIGYRGLYTQPIHEPFAISPTRKTTPSLPPLLLQDHTCGASSLPAVCELDAMLSSATTTLQMEGAELARWMCDDAADQHQEWYSLRDLTNWYLSFCEKVDQVFHTHRRRNMLHFCYEVFSSPKKHTLPPFVVVPHTSCFGVRHITSTLQTNQFRHGNTSDMVSTSRFLQHYNPVQSSGRAVYSCDGWTLKPNIRDVHPGVWMMMHFKADRSPEMDEHVVHHLRAQMLQEETETEQEEEEEDYSRSELAIHAHNNGTWRNLVTTSGLDSFFVIEYLVPCIGHFLFH